MSDEAGSNLHPCAVEDAARRRNFRRFGLTTPSPIWIPNLRMLSGQAIHVLGSHEFKVFRLLRVQGLSEAY